jgi:hypothetical protein
MSVREREERQRQDLVLRMDHLVREKIDLAGQMAIYQSGTIHYSILGKISITQADAVSISIIVCIFSTCGFYYSSLHKFCELRTTYVLCLAGIMPSITPTPFNTRIHYSATSELASSLLLDLRHSLSDAFPRWLSSDSSAANCGTAFDRPIVCQEHYSGPNSNRTWFEGTWEIEDCPLKDNWQRLLTVVAVVEEKKEVGWSSRC